ncbi:prepilin peptidase [archaeon]|nr:prepilin peptidase [archaeon]
MNFLEEINIALANTTIFGVFFFIIGACIGSFYNVVVFRYPKMIDSENAKEIKEWLEDKKIKSPNEIEQYITSVNLSFPSSHCYSCNNALKWYHNIPIFSYLFLRGKCGFCKTKFSIQYPIVELFSGIILLTSYLIFFSKFALLGFILASLFFMLGYLLLLIDIKTMFLPDRLTYSLMWIGIISSVFSIRIIDITLNNSIFGAVIGYLILWIFSTVGKKLKGVDVMGGGDLKLVAAIGAFTGVAGAVFTIFASPFIGIFSWLYFKISKNEDVQFPYGPSLVLSSWIYLFYGKEIYKYLNILI